MRFRIPVVLLIALASPAHSTPQAAPGTLGCTGPFARTATHASLVKAFGARNVVVAKVGIGEGETVTASVIFPRDKTRRVEVLWIDEKRRRSA